jgi:hypothetical protein
MSKLTKEWREFAEAWISFLGNTDEINKQRLLSAIKNYHVGEKESEQEDWEYETKQLIEKIKDNDPVAWKKIFNFIKERYHEYDYHTKILKIAESKKIGKFVWTL